MALDYTGTGHFEDFGKELAILDTFLRHWRYGWKINGSYPSGAAYFPSVLNAIYDNTLQTGDEAEVESKRLLKEEILDSLSDVWRRRKGHLDDFFMSYLAKAMSLDQGTIDEGPIFYEYNAQLLGETGQVSVSRRGGILGALFRQMTFDSQTIRTNGVTIGAVTARPGNQGSLTENTVGGGRSHALSGTITMHCIDDTVGRTLLTCEITLTEKILSDDGDLQTIAADNFITVGADYEDGPTGLTLQMRYVTAVESGDNNNMVSGFAWDKPNETDADKGK